MRTAVRTALLAAALLVGGCAHAPPARSDPNPESALSRWLDSVRAGRDDDAYGMMSAAYRRDHDPAAFKRTLREHPNDVEAALARLRAGGATLALRAEVSYGDGDTLPLVVEGGAWKIAGDPLDFYPQATPAEALRSFLRAIDRRRWDVVWRFVPGRHRKSVTIDQLRARWEGDKRAEVAEQAAEVRAHLGEPLEMLGDEARLPLGEKRQVRLLREEGTWRIEALR